MDFYIQTLITTLKSISRVSDLFQTPDKWQMRFLEFPEKKCRLDRGSIHNLHCCLKYYTESLYLDWNIGMNRKIISISI